MKVVCVGGGPAGRYFSILMKLHDRAHDITVLERNPSGLTYGWGVVFWDDLLDAVRHSDPPTAAGMEQRSFRWVDQLVQVEGGQAVSLGGGGYGLGRQALLDLLSERAAGLGVRVLFEHEADDRAQLDGADLVVACDGVNSRLRRRHQDQLQTSIAVGSNPYVWLGTSKVFEAFTFAFAQTSAGWIWFHAYAFNDQASTFIVECAPETWAGLGFDRLGVDDTLRLLEQIFERRLEGHRLLVHAQDDRAMPWLRFRSVSNRRWHHGNLVLMGDAAPTTHFTIGSGTKRPSRTRSRSPSGCTSMRTSRPRSRRTPASGGRNCCCHSGRRPTVPNGSSTSRAMSACPLPVRHPAPAATLASAAAPSSTPVLLPVPGDRGDRGVGSALGAGQLLRWSALCPPPGLTIGPRFSANCQVAQAGAKVCPPAWPCPARQEPPIKEGHLDGSNERPGWRRWGGKAALARYPGATVLRVETDSDGVYEAHLTTTDGRRVTIEATRPSR